MNSSSTEDPHRLGKYAETDGSHRQVDFIVERLQVEPGARILDLCCGQGRHMVDLLKRGYDVVGVDLSSYMLDHCRKALEAAGVHSCLVRSDMREIDFFSEFDGVINMWTSFGYLETDEDDQKVLDRVAFALKPGGRFLMDMINADRLIRQFTPRLWSENDRGDLLLSECSFDPTTGRLHNREITACADGSRTESVLILRLYSYQEMEKMLKSAGLEIEAVYGDFDSTPFTFEAGRMLIIARKGK